ncbi:uncharacterized protein LOC133624800 isoform X3 [Colius striatus]|uniref:uncharacterized protein LOC133624800 isoform X3 n=1 Tax=Colius striatus TaxID=57412 RepID=UPI002B1E89C3|nr:uncharacterized protein LOC133624800 isoform X3 [Colius striatus]
MKPLPSLILLALLLALWMWGQAAGRQAPGSMLRSRCGAAGCDAALRACESSQEYQKVKTGSVSPWILAYVPIRSCHRVLKDKRGEFSPPAYHGESPISFWCNWTIWAGSKKHIVIYIQGFTTKESCNQNEDKILFEGVSSLVESSVVYACWEKEMHVFATFAQAVHVVLLKRYWPNCRDTQFKAKYYIFQDQEGESSSTDDVAYETPAPKLSKQDGIFQSGWAEELRDVLGFATTRSIVNLGKTMVLSSGLMQGRGTMLGTMALRSPVELNPYELVRTPPLERKAPYVLGSELPGGLRCCEKAQSRGTPEGIIPTAAQDSWEQSFSVSGDVTVGFGYMPRLSSVLLETPLPGALQVAEPLLQPAGVVLESSQSILHPTSRLEDLNDLKFMIKPTCTSHMDLAAHLSSLSPGRRRSQENTDTTMSGGLSTVNLEKEESYPQSNIPVGDADALAKGLMASLSSPYEVVNRDYSHLLPEKSQRCQSCSRHLPITQPELEKNSLQYKRLMDISSLESFRGVVRGETALHPTAPWDILQEHHHLRGQSSRVLHSALTDHVSLPQHAQAHVSPAAEKAHGPSLGVKSCCHQSDQAAQPGLVVPPLSTRLEHPSTAISTLRTETVPVLVVSCTEPVPADFGSTDVIPEPPLPLGTEPVSKVISPPAALHLEPSSLRQRAGISPASPEEQEMVSPSPPCHPSAVSELGADGSPGCLHPGIQKQVLEKTGGQQEASAPLGLPTGGPSPASVTNPKPGVGLPWPEDHKSRGSGLASPSLPDTWGVRREGRVVPAQHQGTGASDKLAFPSILGGFKVQKTTKALQVGAGEWRNSSSSATPAHSGSPVAQEGETVSRGQKLPELSDSASRNTEVPEGQQQTHAELGPPWAMQYSPVRSCHLVFRDGSGMFSLPLHADVTTTIWCNWTIVAGSQKHVVIYIQGFQGSDGCGKNQDKIIFQGVSSSVETKVVYACHNRGTLVFAAQAAAVHVLFLSGSGSPSHQYEHFKGQYYVFRDSETVGSSNDIIAPQQPFQEVSRKGSQRTAVTKGLLTMLKASLGPSGALSAGRIQPELVSPDEEAQDPPDLVVDAQSGADLNNLDLNECGQLLSKRELERTLKDDSTKGRGTKDGVLMEPSPTRQGNGSKAELSALGPSKGDEELVSALVTIAPCSSVVIPSSEMPNSNRSVSAKSSSLGQAKDGLSEEVVAAAHPTQASVLEEPLLNTSTKPSLYPSPNVTAGGVMSPEEGDKELLDLFSALASLENDTVLQSQHHPGDVLFEVTTEIKSKDWISRSGSDLLESMKNHIQENLKLSTNRVNEIKLKEIKRTSDANLLLTFWLHLKPEERNVSLLLHSQLQELLGTSAGVEKLQLISLYVEDVNECRAGVSLCGEGAECFNGVGTYLCRCKKEYEDHSPTKSGTLCIRPPLSAFRVFSSSPTPQFLDVCGCPL